jgi:hypothetical protein
MTEKQIRDMIADASDMSDQVTDFINHIGDDNHIAIDIIEGMVAIGIGATEGKGIVFIEAENALELKEALENAANHIISLRDA